MDTAGQDDYQTMFDSWVSFGEGFLLVYAINDKESFNGLMKRRDRILKLRQGQPCPLVLVGHKCDLEDQREVSKEEAADLAKSWGVEYIETSSVVFIINIFI